VYAVEVEEVGGVRPTGRSSSVGRFDEACAQYDGDGSMSS
jgi:hypothetical protein